VNHYLRSNVEEATRHFLEDKLENNEFSRSEDNNNHFSKSRQPNEGVRIVFLVQHPSVWSSWQSVWAVASKDPQFIVKVVLTPFFHEFSSVVISYCPAPWNR
jgi:hypothetical protein